MNNFKEKYRHKLPAGKRRQTLVQQLLKDDGWDTEIVGYLAHTDQVVYDDEPHVTGDADLRITGTSVYVEVTGTDKRITRHSPLWVRPDKVEAAIKLGEETWVAHVTEQLNLIRAIRVDDDYFLRRYGSGDLPIMEKWIDGGPEHYVIIPAHDAVVRPFEFFLDRLNMFKM